jgi:hypothetical protein
MITYEQNKNTVIAKFSQNGKLLKNVWRDCLMDYAFNYVNNTAYNTWGFVEDTVDKVMQDRKLVGIAKCHPHDEFDLEEGKRIAREDLINRFNLAKTQLKKEILYAIKKDVKNIKDRM